MVLRILEDKGMIRFKYRLKFRSGYASVLFQLNTSTTSI